MDIKIDLAEVKNYTILRNIEVHMYSLLRSHTGRYMLTHALPKCISDELAAFFKALKTEDPGVLALIVKKLYEAKPEALAKFIEVWLQIYPEDKKIAHKTECKTTVGFG